MLREQNGYKEETDEEFLSEALTLLRKITDEAAKKILLAQIKAIWFLCFGGKDTCFYDFAVLKYAVPRVTGGCI